MLTLLLTNKWSCSTVVMSYRLQQWKLPFSEANSKKTEDAKQKRRRRRKKVFISLCAASTTDFAHPLWLSYALSCSRRLQMPSRPLQLASLSLEPVYQQGYLTATAAPEASDPRSGWEGCQQSLWKREKTHTMKSEGITVHSQEWQHCFRATSLVTQIKPIILWRTAVTWHLWYLLCDWGHFID